MPAPIPPIAVRAWTVSSAAGLGRAALASGLAGRASALRPLDATRWPAWPLATWVGAVDALDAPDPAWPPFPAALADRDLASARALRLAWLGLQADGFRAATQAAVQRWGAARVGLLLGTSASTIGVSEQAWRDWPAGAPVPEVLRHPTLNTPHAVTGFVAEALGLRGPALTVSTACSSSAKVFASAERWLRLGWVDAVVVGGVDALCASVLFGFRALGLVSASPCRPFDAARDGISIGEAAGYALLERRTAGDDPATPCLVGHGESNDAHHMSSPHPQGLGAERALDDALARAGVDAGAVDLVCLHGTASARNDEVEAALVARRYRADVHASAAKGLTGHTMGAAGIVQAVACLEALGGAGLPGSVGCVDVDPALPAPFGQQLRLVADPAGRADLAASHSFGFGGNNCVLLFGRAGAVA
ncbi:beta-ketoacyl synthase N-terminal-like domain-containing protein [Leptothrix discophora]|uniref:Beta-ketoacyl synthase N-terminal-like domain-containing protein n=1 Tax=Leptothrix discophora TaxID=89 RepID=A0ABT9G8S7_LEPDI|nr:beta-ketoacyl synthase N-terminal-like domain-containing protein [Leptothrix discophora]MDP4302894.1 beta-ketoacyl synthase N-terminal-like domain-containing protein [Leptothrix discophora]